MHRKCRNCLCRTCMKVCRCHNCKGKIKVCKRYSGFVQMSIFEPPSQYRKAPRHSWEHYGITKERYRQLTEYIQSGRYAPIASSTAHATNEMIAEYILLSVVKNLSYEGLQAMWARGKIERIPESRTNFYAWRRYFYHLFDLELRRIGK